MRRRGSHILHLCILEERMYKYLYGYSPRDTYIYLRTNAAAVITSIFGTSYALPACPTWIISVTGSSFLSTGQEVLSALTSVISNFVPMILYVDLSVSISPKRGISLSYLLLSEVRRSRETELAENAILAESLTIFLRNKEAITVVGVW